jgi:hypothetical protein
MALEDATNPMRGVSGPGKFARRTDLQYSPDTYGAGVEMAAQKAGAPLATAPKSPMLSQAPQVPAASATTDTGVGLYDPTQRPNEPITAGIDRGAGPGSNALMMAKSTEKLSDTLAKMLPYDTTGEVGILYQNALSRGL